MPIALIWCRWPHNPRLVATMLVGGRKIEREEFNQELAALDRRRDRSFDRSGSAAGAVGNNQTSELFQLKKQNS